MAVGFLDLVEESFYLLVGRDRKQNGIVAAEKETAPVAETSLIVFQQPHSNFVLADFTRVNRRRPIGIIEQITFWQFDRYVSSRTRESENRPDNDVSRRE